MNERKEEKKQIVKNKLVKDVNKMDNNVIIFQFRKDGSTCEK